MHAEILFKQRTSFRSALGATTVIHRTWSAFSPGIRVLIIMNGGVEVRYIQPSPNVSDHDQVRLTTWPPGGQPRPDKKQPLVYRRSGGNAARGGNI